MLFVYRIWDIADVAHYVLPAMIFVAAPIAANFMALVYFCCRVFRGDPKKDPAASCANLSVVHV